MSRKMLGATCLIFSVALVAAQPGAGETEAQRAAMGQPQAATLDDLVRAAGLDPEVVSARLGRQRGASSGDAGFALIFCPVHGRYEPPTAAAPFARPATRASVDPLFD